MALESTLAGSWYPRTAREMRALAEKWEAAETRDEAPPPDGTNVLILPHAGWAYSGETAWRAVRAVRKAAFRRVVVLAPSHRVWIENRLVAPESNAVATPLGEIRIDRDWLDRLALVAPVSRNDRLHAAEHSAQIEYPLLQLALARDFALVPLIMGGFGADQMGMCFRALSRLMDAETLLVVSSDFTHYGTDFSYAPHGTGGGAEVRARVAASDAEAFALMAKGDADGFAAFVARTGATICGHVPIEMALHAFPRGASLTRLRYATSSDGGGDFSRFVCYVAAAGRVAWPGERDAVLGAEDRRLLLRVARETIERAVRGEPCFVATADGAETASPAVRMKMGAFVTLNDRTTGALRGCIGEIQPMRPLVAALPENWRRQYDRIASDADIVSPHNFTLPEAICVTRESESLGKSYSNHLFCNEEGRARFMLTTWEEGVLEEEFARPDFVCWLRNISRASWALRLPYDVGDVKKPFYPDLFIVRKHPTVQGQYLIDLLEPHGQQFSDNVAKAKALADYAAKNPALARVQMIREMKSPIPGEKVFKRLDMAKSSVRTKVMGIHKPDELDQLFAEV